MLIKLLLFIPVSICHLPLIFLTYWSPKDYFTDYFKNDAKRLKENRHLINKPSNLQSVIAKNPNILRKSRN